MLSFSLTNTLPSEVGALSSLLWSVIDAAAECDFTNVNEGMILPGVHGETLVRLGDEAAILSPYIWSTEMLAPYAQQCDHCNGWIDQGAPYYHRALFTIATFPDSICKACADKPSADVGEAFATPAVDTEWERFASQAMASASPYGWDVVGGGC